jgi:EAL domain-containing protein (putative c-di-GMP-specific phosphodiesterase class I)
MVGPVWDPELSAQMRGASHRGEIVPFFQPQVDVADGTVVAVELLARWEHPSRGFLSPKDFISLAEETGLIHEIGMFMLEEACRCATEWQGSGLSLGVAVNVSVQQLETSEFYDRLLGLLHELAFDPRLLTLEITESQPIQDFALVTHRLTELRRLGFDLSIDDFGSGYSTMQQLLDLPVSEVKIDRSLILDAYRHGPGVLASVMEVARERGLRVVAEGIETDPELRLAEDLGCDRVQGYLLSRPVPEAEMQRLLQRGH